METCFSSDVASGLPALESYIETRLYERNFHRKRKTLQLRGNYQGLRTQS